MPITVPEVTIAKNIFIRFSSLEYFINIAFNLILKNEKEDIQASQRVEFRAVTKAEERIYEIINKLQ
jgi:hypothetical protein